MHVSQMTRPAVHAVEELFLAYRRERDRKNIPAASAALSRATEELGAHLSRSHSSYFTVARGSLAFIPDSATSSNSICFCFTTENDRKPYANRHLFGKIPQGNPDAHAPADEASRAFLLESVGYPVDVPLAGRTGSARPEIVIYPYIDEKENPVMHCLALDIEAAGCVGDAFLEVTHEYEQIQKRIGEILTRTLHTQDAPCPSREKFHDLFYMRLVDKQGDAHLGARAKAFYLDKDVRLPDGRMISFGSENAGEKALWDLEWRINGRAYPVTLRNILERAKDILHPAKIAPVYVTAHGDDHIGNMRYDRKAPVGQKIICFDPEFAGTRIPALMAMTKSLCNSALAHPNLFLHPEKHAGGDVVEIMDSTISIRFDDSLTPLRASFLQSQRQHVWLPLISAMRDRGILPENWEAVSRLALACCLLLVRNLISEDRMRHQTSMASLATTIMFASAPLNGEDAVSDFFRHIQEKVSLS